MSATAEPTPIVITAGGTYSGTWASHDGKTPAVAIETTHAVVLQNCTITSNTTLIETTVSNAHVTVENCYGDALDPKISGQTNGDFLDAYEIGSLDFEHNSMENVAFGVRLYNGTPNGPITIRYNKAVNLQGLPSNGKNGRVTKNLSGIEDNENHFVSIAEMHGLANVQIAWNEIDTASGANTASIGDVINIYDTSGTAKTPILIHDNFIYGGYPANPNATLYYAAGIVTDGTASDTAATATAFVHIYDNQVVAHAGNSISIAAGHDNEVYSNRIVSSGQYPNGTWYVGYTGVSVQDCTCYNQPSSVYFNNWAKKNVSGDQFEQPNGQGQFEPPAVTSDYYLPDCAGGTTSPGTECTDDVEYSPTPITADDEKAEVTMWQQKLSANGITLGPSDSATAGT